MYEWDFGQNRGRWTGGMTSVFGYPPGEIEPGYDWWLERVHPDDRERVNRLNREAFATGTPYVAEYRFRTRSGSYRDVLDRAIALAGEPARWVGGLVNITDLRQLERQLHQAQRLEAIGRLAGGIAHDFNNLLTGILGYVELLGERILDDPRATADLREIHKAAERAASLTSQLLAFSRRQLLEPRVVDVARIVEDVRPLLERLLGEDVELVCTGARTRRTCGRPGPTRAGDSSRFQFLDGPPFLVGAVADHDVAIDHVAVHWKPMSRDRTEAPVK